MKINVAQLLMDYDGKTPIPTVVQQPGKPPMVHDTVLRDVIARALDAHVSDPNMAPDEKFRVFNLGVKVAEADTDIDLDDASWDLILSALSKGGGLGYGRVRLAVESARLVASADAVAANGRTQ